TDAAPAEAPADPPTPPVDLVDLYAPRRRGREDRPRRPQGAPAGTDAAGDEQRRPRRPRKGGGKGKAKSATTHAEDSGARKPRPAKTDRAAKPVDPDNPFAKLLEIKFDR
ncbi:MAG: hypothetical protein AAF684_05530, partial [Pseudomonadota bacterium]